MWKNKRSILASMTGFGALILMLSGAASASDTASTPNIETSKTLFSERCSGCHALDTVTTQHASDKEWRAIVERMILNGAQLSKVETETVVAYLAKAQGPQN